MRAITTEDHARILYAYLGRLRPKDLDDILELMQKHHYSAMNHGLRQQALVQERLSVAVSNGIENMTTYDLGLIDSIVSRIGAQAMKPAAT